MQEILFYKYNGTGNDFVVISNIENNIKLSSEQIKKICDRHFGVGADGLILVEKSENGGDYFMNYYNADGSLAEMCGNGARCTAQHIKDILNFKNKKLELDTRAGIKEIEFLNSGLFRVNMGSPDFEHYDDFPRTTKKFDDIEFQFVSIGNPHAVGIFNSKDDIEKHFLNLGKNIESNTRFFPNKINVNFVTKLDDNHFYAKTFERGVGPTLACGTGMCATFAIVVKNRRNNISKQETKIDMPGGTLYFKFNNNGEILMTGPSQRVFKGKIKI